MAKGAVAEVNAKLLTENFKKFPEYLQALKNGLGELMPKINQQGQQELEKAFNAYQKDKNISKLSQSVFTLLNPGIPELVQINYQEDSKNNRVLYQMLQGKAEI